MSQTSSCPKCGAELPADAPAGLCPKCLVQAGFESENQPQPELARTAASPASHGFEPPTVAELAARFPQLEILELLGKGGMGAVYKARQPGLDRLVAVKILPPEISRDQSFAERFTREARALARLSHPNIVAVYDFGQADGMCFFVMEYVDGVNLRQAIQAGGMTPQTALAIVPQVCDALQFAHDEGIVHRDVKPENILIDKRGRVKIADFGLAKLLGREQADPMLTRTQQVMGTLRYMAPEQMEGSHEVDHRADIYSLGVVFYELLTGELPIGRFAAPSKKVQIDVRLDEVVLRALEKEPEQRWQHASDVKTEIQSIDRSAPPGSHPAPRDELEQIVLTFWPDKIAAIRRYRWATGAGLADAKQAVELTAARLGLADPKPRNADRLVTVACSCAAAVALLFLTQNSPLEATARAASTVAIAVGCLAGFAGLLVAWRRQDARTTQGTLDAVDRSPPGNKAAAPLTPPDAQLSRCALAGAILVPFIFAALFVAIAGYFIRLPVSQATQSVPVESNSQISK